MFGTLVVGVTKSKAKKEQEPPVGRYTQWSEGGGSFAPVGNTVSAIQPGHYDITEDQSGRPIFMPVRSRGDDMIFFPDSPSVSVVNGIIDFWEREDRFKRYNLPFKRGILLYGPPGSGKTCTLELVARDVVDRGGIVITFPGSVQLLLAAYRALRDIQPDIPLIVLMEDFEVLLQQINESRLLNMLDGVEQLHKVVFLATTNYPERLPDRIINRPSRFDIRICVAGPSAPMRRTYLRGLIDGDDAGLDIDRYVRDTEGMSLAHVKELFVSAHVLGVNYNETVRRLRSMKDKVTSLDVEMDGDDLGEYVVGGYA